MIVRWSVIALGVIGSATGVEAADRRSAADLITCRDGTVIEGLVLSVSPGSRGAVELAVRRGWAEKSLPKHVQGWDHAAAPKTHAAIKERANRLTAWRRERAPVVERDDRIINWIDHERERLADPRQAGASILLKLSVPRGEIRAIERRPAGLERLLRAAWLVSLPEPESMSVDELKIALDARGIDVDGAAHKPPAALERLLPPEREPEMSWLSRRAATELAIDTDLRFIRFQDAVIPDSGAVDALAGAGLSTAVSELKRFLSLDEGLKADPLKEKLDVIATRGRVGAVVTRLDIQEDLSNVKVESTLWVRDGRRWLPFGSRYGTVRPDDLERGAGKNLAEDPQVKMAFQFAEILGLGSIAPEIKERTLRIGAATEKALGMARSAFNEDLEALALPILESSR